MKAIAGPQAHPIIQTLHWMASPVGYLETVAQDYPDVFRPRLWDWSKETVFIHHPQWIQEVLSSDSQRFTAPGDRTAAFLKPVIGDDSILALSGDSHRRMRQLLFPAFHGERMQTHGQLIWNLTHQIMAAWVPGQTFSGHEVARNISLEAILHILFGNQEGDQEQSRYQQIKQSVLRLTDLFNSPLQAGLLLFSPLQRDLGPGSPWRNFCALIQSLDELLAAEIALARQESERQRTDLLAMLIGVRDEAGQGLTDQELRDQLVTLLFTGHETTASTIAWGLYWLHRCPAARDQLLAELTANVPPVDPSQISRLPYLTAVCHETLRLNPVVLLTLPRVAQTTTEIMGFAVEAGTRFFGCSYLLHQRPDLYPRPKQFRPERFLERQFSPYEFMPFGHRARSCIGSALAQYEIKLVLANILLNYQLTLTDQRPERPQRLAATIVPARGVQLRLERRRNPNF